MEQYLNLIPIPVALGMVLYVNHSIEKHEKECSVGAILTMVKDRQAEIDKKIDRIMEHLMK